MAVPVPMLPLKISVPLLVSVNGRTLVGPVAKEIDVPLTALGEPEFQSMSPFQFNMTFDCVTERLIDPPLDPPGRPSWSSRSQVELSVAPRNSRVPAVPLPSVMVL